MKSTHIGILAFAGRSKNLKVSYGRLCIRVYVMSKVLADGRAAELLPASCGSIKKGSTLSSGVQVPEYTRDGTARPLLSCVTYQESEHHTSDHFCAGVLGVTDRSLFPNRQLCICRIMKSKEKEGDFMFGYASFDACLE
jgi:hypothetical protein